MQKRLYICNNCPIYDADRDLCNAQLFINPETNDVSISPKKGYFKGCGCVIRLKVKNPNKHCPAKKW